MMRNLLITAAFDLEGGNWFAGRWNAIVATMVPGKAGPIAQTQMAGAAFALRRNELPGAPAGQIAPLDLQAGEDGVITLFAGRLSERVELARHLGVSPALDDAQLYGEAYRRLGEHCDEAIVGTYAAIQWLAAKRQVRLVRSALQAPPLHLWRSGKRLVAASLPQSIHAAGVRAEPDMASIADAGLLNFRKGSRSFYRGLSRIACGSCELHGPAGAERRAHWSVPSPHSRTDRSTGEIVETAAQLLDRAVADALAGARQPAISLSGGLDSQLVAASVLKMGEQASSCLRSYTSVPVAEWLPREDERLRYDERDTVEALARHSPGLTPCFITGQELRYGEDLDALFTLGGWPPVNEMNMHWVHALHRQAARDGCDVMLHGELGDSSISYEGLTAYPSWLVQGRWQHLWRELAALADGSPFWRRFAALALLPVLPRGLRRLANRASARAGDAFARWCPLDPEQSLVREALHRAASEGHDVDFLPLRNARAARAAMIAQPVSQGPEIDLGLRLLHGIERRDPFAFRPLWEFCATLPDEIFVRCGERRWLARQLLRQRAPPGIAVEQRVAIQSADMLGRMQRDRARIVAEIEELRRNSRAGEVIALDRLAAIARNCNGPDGDGERDWLRVCAQLPRGLALARFVHHLEQLRHG